MAKQARGLGKGLDALIPQTGIKNGKKMRRQNETIKFKRRNKRNIRRIRKYV